jgi:glycosyltransferase involved in cell wall biosynthesis
LGLPTVTTAHGWRFPLGKSPFQRWAIKAMERLAAPLAARIITVCESDRELAIRSRVAKAHRLVTIHNALPDVEPGLRAQPDESPPRLLMVARFTRQKDHATLFRALSGLLDIEWHLDLVGSGPLRATLEALADSMGIASCISFLGLRRDVPKLMARSQAVLLITHWEGFPRSILEAMRAGLPTVATDAGGARESVLDGETGFLITKGDVDALRGRLRELMFDGALRARMGAAGRALYEQRFTFPALVESTIAVYDTVLEERSFASHDLRGKSR